MESDVDSEGEDLEILRPTLIQELRNILDEYPDDGQILKELIQNAEDAGATKVKILTDNRLFNHQLESDDVKKHPHLKFWQGPGLCVYNDARFKDKDWDGIRMLHMSIKEKDPLKVGRFGLGFKSVFHMTDRLVILSGNSLMYMDPFKPEDRYCKKTGLAGKRGRELKSLLMCLEGVFGVTKETFCTGSRGFPGTLFWFPLRQSGSELSSTVYSQAKVQKLISSFQAEAPSLLLFLNNITRVTVYTREDVCEPRKFFSVGLAASCHDTVCEQRMNFVTSIRQGGQDLPETGCYCQTELVMETVEFCADSSEHKETCRKSQRWVIALYHPGQQELSEELKQLCADPELSYKPLVGVAVPLTSHCSFQSQLFCFLPLPLETHSPTGLPVHVNGFFALSQNRRHLKWPSADQLSQTEQLDPPLRWNCLLVEELMPQVYGALLDRLRLLEGTDLQQIYSTWPDESSVDDRWKPLLRPLYNALCSQPSFYSHSHGGQWVNLSQAVLEELSQPILMRLAEEARDEEEAIRVKESVAKVYSLNGEKLVQLPDHVHHTLDDLGLLQSIDIMTGDRVCHLLPTSFPHLSDDDRLHLLQFLCCHDNILDLVQGQQLLPLADRTFATFHDVDEGQPVIRLCSDNLLNLFPGLESQFCNNRVSPAIRKSLCMMASSGKFAFQTLEEDDADIPELIEKSLRIRFGNQQPSLLLDDIWIQRIWDFLTSKELGHYSHLNLLPEMRDGDLTLLPLSGIYVCSLVTGIAPLTTELTSCLSKLRVKVLPALPDFVTRHKDVLGHWVFFPSAEGLMAALKRVSDDSTLRQLAVDEFDANASAEEKEALITLLINKESETQQVLRLFRKLKLFTETTTGDAVSVEEVYIIAPDTLPPIMSQKRMLSCSHPQRLAASILGSCESTMLEVVSEVIQLIQPGTSHFSSTEIVALMKFALSHEELTNDATFIELIKCVKLVPTSSGQLKLAHDLYDPTSPQLKKMFLAEHKFPSDNFLEPGFLNVLKVLGLRGEDTLDLNDIVRTSKIIEDLWESGEKETAKEKAEGLSEVLFNHGQLFDAETLKIISNRRCLPCEDDESRPSFYPSSLPYSPSPKLARPQDMCHSSQTQLIGSVLPIIKLNVPSAVAQGLQIDSQINKEHVKQNLDNVLTHYQIHEASQYRLILGDIFHFLGQHVSDTAIVHAIHEKECVLLESGDRFAKPGAFWVEKREEDIQLKPYRFPLPSDMRNEKEFFLACGAAEHQDASLLRAVLLEIQTYHSQHTRSQSDFNRDFLIVGQILCELSKSDTAADGTVILPVFHSDPNVLHFQQAKNCTVLSHDGLSVSSFTDDTDIFIVHERIHQDTAMALGAMKMKDRALTGLEDLDFEYEQEEELTNRLHDLLMNSYTDGFSVPKELIQNADDAGATEVCFLLDERENEDARKNLITDTLDSFQGPAFWAYNNATFSDEDFENIKKLGAGTKKEDTSKVGRFGLGFNSVYNLTDVPSFISRHTMAMFDPHKKYLKERKAGLRMDFRRSVNRSLLSRMPNQFKPFQGIFGCELQSSDDVNYNGTLFRFPLRTEVQAKESKIKKESYSKGKRREFLKMLLERAGSVLTFTQFVKTLKVFYLPSDCTDPSSPQCLLDLTKTSNQLVLQPEMQLGDQSILQYFSLHWSTYTNIQILEDFRIEMKVTENATSVCEVEAHSSTTHWHLAWASGIAQSATLTHEMGQEGLVPMAAVAALTEDGVLQTVQKSPQGFYMSGHYFCFLPLPGSKENWTLPVHVNATFALKSSRRSMLTSTDEDLDNIGARWNSALVADAVSRAYLLLLENVQNETASDNDFKHFFQMWPVCGEGLLVENFFRCLVNDRNKVFPVTEETIHWADFTEVWFMDQQFRKSKCGNIAWQAMQHFWKGDGHLVDIPTEVFSAFEHSEQNEKFKARTITANMFYTDFFFPNIAHSYWQQQDRDELVYYALLQDELRHFVEENSCIPCAGTENLKRPKELIHPKGAVSKLYSLSDSCFPQGHQREEKSHSNVNFCSESSLNYLLELGMIIDELPSEMLLERATSVCRQLTGSASSAQQRAKALIDYLSAYTGKCYRIHNYPQDTINKLSTIRFLPVLRKPSEWPFPWASQDVSQLAAPCELYLECFEQLVGCHKLVVDSKALEISSRSYSKIGVLKLLRLVTEECLTTELFELSVQQLQTVALATNQNPGIQTDLTQGVCQCIYSYLTKYLEHDRDTVIERLSQEDVVWTKTGFVKPSQVALCLNFDCQPYRFRLETVFRDKCLPFLMAIGVKDRFDAANLVSAITEVCFEFSGRELPVETVDLVSRTAQMLAESMESSSGFTDTPIYLPDRHNYMKLTRNLCLDDCEWLKESENMTFVSDKIPNETAKKLGVESKRSKDFESFVDYIPFGQNEKLTDRIKRLLEGYTLDSSLFKELLQNADDAGATEIKFIKDWRHLGHEKVLEGCEILQGPALCVFNDRSFTKKRHGGYPKSRSGQQRRRRTQDRTVWCGF